MSAGPYPTKPMFERLKRRQDQPVYLGQEQITDAGVRITGASSQRDVSAVVLAFSGARGGGAFESLSGSVNWTSALASLKSMTCVRQGETLYSYTAGSNEAMRPALGSEGYRLDLPYRLPMDEGVMLALEFSAPVRWTGAAPDSTAVSPLLSQVAAADAGGQQISDWLPEVAAVLPSPDVRGRLAGRHMPIVTGYRGEVGAFQIVHVPGAEPYLIYTDDQGNPYHVPLTPGLPQ